MTPKTREAYNIFPPGPHRTSHVPGLCIERKNNPVFFRRGTSVQKPVRDRFWYFSRGGEVNNIGVLTFLTIFRIRVCFSRKSPSDVTSVIDVREVIFPRSSVCVRSVWLCIYTSLSKVDWIRHSSACNGIVITYTTPRTRLTCMYLYVCNVWALVLMCVCVMSNGNRCITSCSHRHRRRRIPKVSFRKTIWYSTRIVDSVPILLSERNRYCDYIEWPIEIFEFEKCIKKNY